MQHQIRGSIHRLIDAFEDVFPGISNEISHSVISDYNIRNSDLDYAIRYVEERLLTESDLGICEVLESTRHFLKCLRAINEVTRAYQAHEYYDWEDPDASWQDYIETEELLNYIKEQSDVDGI